MIKCRGREIRAIHAIKQSNERKIITMANNENEHSMVLTDEELEAVTGGNDGGNSVSLIGPYYGDSYGGGGKHTAAVGWSGLTIGRIFSDRAAPVEIKHDGVTINWAPWSSISIS